MTHDIKIEKGIIRPMTGYKGAAFPNYPKAAEMPWERMSIGDSFFIPVEDGADLVRLMNRITGAGRYHVGVRCVSARAVFEGGAMGVRAWLIDRPGGRID
jgi:hypothetical protein